MGYIGRLPQSVICRLRSSSILSDLSQAVEELICNSLDAGAKKICVYFDLRSFYIRVEDDGSGVTRDDLLLIGERHATSKLHDMVELESGVKTLGFRGEALSSLSDIGIVEIVTRVRGSPNTYKKIVKGSKKLSLGLYGEQRTPGTTVVLRELFHNLPVRRKVAESSPKKVLQGVKDRTVRLALIHPDVSFAVFDLERQENLLCIKSYSSSLDTLCEIFGEHLRHELQDLHYAKKYLKVDGFISRETSRFTSKAIQFLYLNGRFVHKTPVHKLINTLFCRHKCVHELGNSLDAGMSSAALKQVYPMFLLNLHCPLSCYDITLEVTKNSVEFKDWKSVLLFVTEALRTSWSRLSQNLDEGAEHHLTKSKTLDFKKLTPRKRKPWQHVDPTYRPRCNIDMSKPESNCCGLVGGLQNAEEIDCDAKMRQDLTFDTPKRTRGPRERRAFVSFREELANSDVSNSSWSLQPCSTRRKVETGAKENDWSVKMRQGLTFDTPKRTRGPRKRRASVSICEELVNNNVSNSSWSLQPFSTRRKIETGAREDKNLHRPEGREDFWCEEESIQRLRGEWSVGFSFHNVSVDGIVESKFQDVTSVKEFVCGEESSFLTLADVARVNTFNPSRVSDALDSYPKLRDLSFDGQVEVFDDVLRRENLLGFGESTSAMVDFMQTPPQLRRSLSVCSPRVRRCLYGLDVKPSFTDDFWCHSERQILSNLEMKAYCKKGEEILTPNPGALCIGFPSHSFCRDSQDEIEQECQQNNLISPKSMHSLSEYKSLLSPQSKERDIFDSLPISLTHAINRNCTLDKGGKASQRQLLKQTSVKDSEGSPQTEEIDVFSLLPTPSSDVLHENVSTHAADKAIVSDKGDKVAEKKQSTVQKLLGRPPNTHLQRALSGPPFYRSPLKHAISDGLSNLDGFGECNSGREFQKGGARFDIVQDFSTPDLQGNFQKKKQLLEPLKDRCEGSRGADFGFQKRGLQEAAKPQVEDIQIVLPARRFEEDCIESKWRDIVYDDMATKDGPTDTALQLYKDWRNPCIRSVEPNILDLSSVVLGPSNKHLFPESISKEGLQKAQVLQQMDRKFIATVAKQVLFVIDQHAADERVRLEQLRKEVLEEKQHLSALLDYPQELSISLGEQQLLHTYKAQVEEWGWRFKILAERQDNKGRRLELVHHGNTVALLTGVPNVLGEGLTNGQYLSEYLHQLASTDGTSTPPPAVLRVLASKACRGAIMFGDHLLRSECQQLVEGLKKTALSFQCAHGRPTLVPIVNLEALHMQLGKRYCANAWHGVQWHRSTLKRAMERLKQAENM